MPNFQENIVPATNQNSASNYLYNNPSSKVRILFVGNSITKHGPKPDIGWERDCGMAASSVDCDYVHLIVKKIMEKYDPNVSYGIAQVAHYEQNFFESTPADRYEKAKQFDANLLICFYGANVPKTYDTATDPKKTFGQAYEDMRNYLAAPQAEVYHSMGFYIRPVLEAEKLAVAEKYGETYIDISDIRALPETHGMFNHPNDLGMQMIADRFFEAIEGSIKKICEDK